MPDRGTPDPDLILRDYPQNPNPAMPYDRTDRFTVPYRRNVKPSGWDREHPSTPWDPYGGGRVGANQGLFDQPPWSDLRRGAASRIPASDLVGILGPAGREGYFNPWDDPPPTTENIERILRGKSPSSAEKFIRENSSMINQ